MGHTRTLTRLAAVTGGTALIMAAGAFPAVAADDSADGDVQVINTETVQAYTDATGEVQSQRLYEQLALTGEGPVDLANPVELSGLRNLESFSGFSTEDGNQIVDVDVDGQANYRSVSDYNEDLPLEVEVEYILDGEPITPTSLVGESGELEVIYTVKNVTNQPQTITYTDGKGGTVEETADVMVPMVGSLETTLPSNFREVEGNGANMAGDGEGGTRMSWTMTLLAPLGADTVQLGYTAQVEDAVAPGASISALPVNPLENPTLSNAASSYKGGADTGEELADGAAQIDSNLLKLRDGAADLLAGLIKLRNGADQLEEGLKEEAAPGARKLANGAGDLNDGLGELEDGAGRLADGTGDLRSGVGDLSDGAGKLNDGAGELNDGASLASDKSGELAAGLDSLVGGVKQLSDGVDGLPAKVKNQLDSDPQYQRLLSTLDTLIGGIGELDQTNNTLLGGINKIRFGLRNPLCDPTAPTAETCGVGDVIGAVTPGLNDLVASLEELQPNLANLQAGALGAYQATIDNGCPALVGPGVPPPPDTIVPPGTPAGLLPLCRGASAAYYGYASIAQDVTAESVGRLGAGVAGLEGANAGIGALTDTASTTLLGGLNLLKQALSNPGCDPTAPPGTATSCGYKQALQLIRQGIPTLVDGILDGIQAELTAGIGTKTTNCDPTKSLLCGAAAAADGGGRLSDGLGDLADGTGRLSDGTGDLVDGVGRLSDGAVKLDDGAGQLSDGASRAEAGSLLIADGAQKLADGLFEAAGGSGLLAQGLGTAAKGAPKLVDGASRLSDEGTKKLVEAGEETAQEYGKQYALIMAGAERAEDERMIVGAPDQSLGLAAYSFEIQGEDGEGSRNVARTLGGLALLGAGAGLFALRRRFI